MSSINAQLAHAARQARALADRLPESERPDLAREWRALLDQLELAPPYETEEAIDRWRRRMRERLPAGR
jgi:hypothetical protein